MPNEVRVFAEGSLRWVVASGQSGAWLTASAAPTALVGFVQMGMQGASAQPGTVVKERGVPSHHKSLGRDAVRVTFTMLEAVTANDPAMVVTGTAQGASVPLVHFEHKSKAHEDGSALYRQFMHCRLVDNNWTEGEQGNEKAQTWECLSMSATFTGYLTTALA